MRKYLHCVYHKNYYCLSRVIMAESFEEAYDKALEDDTNLAAPAIEKDDLLIEVLEDTSVGLVTNTYILIDGKLALTDEKFAFREDEMTSNLMRLILLDDEYLPEFIPATLYSLYINQLVNDRAEVSIEDLPVSGPDEVAVEREEEKVWLSI